MCFVFVDIESMDSLNVTNIWALSLTRRSRVWNINMALGFWSDPRREIRYPITRFFPPHLFPVSFSSAYKEPTHKNESYLFECRKSVPRTRSSIASLVALINKNKWIWNQQANLDNLAAANSPIIAFCWWRRFLCNVNNTRALIGLCLLVTSHWGQIRDPWHS